MERVIEPTNKKANSCAPQHPNVNFLTDLCDSNLGQQGGLDMGSMDFLGRVLITILAKAMKQTHDDFPVVCCERFCSHRRGKGEIIQQTNFDL